MTTSQSMSASFYAQLPGPHYCERCAEQLNNETAVWLELNTLSGLYRKEGTVPPAESQGCFPFGAACASAVLKAGGKNLRIRAGAKCPAHKKGVLRSSTSKG